MHVFTETAQSGQGPDFLTIGMLLLLAVMIFFMFRSSRKRKQQAAELQSKMTPGVRIMTSSGIFGTLLWIDDEKTQAGIEIAPGVEIVVHRQIVSQVVEEPTQTDASDDVSRED